MNTIEIDRLKIAAAQKVKERDYWLAQLAEPPGKIGFAVLPDRQGTNDGEKDTGFLSTHFTLEPEVSEKLLKLSNNSEPRLHMILVTGISLLLHKYSGNKDIIVGTPIYKEEEEGQFMNTVLPLRYHFDTFAEDDDMNGNKNVTFKTVLLQTRKTITDAVEHQDYPLPVLLEQLEIPAEDWPLFDVAVVLEGIQDKRYLTHSSLQATAKIVFSFRNTNSGNAGAVESEVEYNSFFYGKDDVKRIWVHFNRLLSRCLSAIDTPVSEVEILTGEEKKQLLWDFNGIKPSHPAKSLSHESVPLHHLFEKQAAKTPDHPAVVGPVQADGREPVLTYRQLNEAADRVAGQLRASGLEHGSIAGVLSEPSVEMIGGILGILKAGGAYLPLDPNLPPQRILSILDDSGCSTLLKGLEGTAHLPFTSLSNIAKIHAEPVKTSPRGQIKDLNQLPLPDRTLIDYGKYHQHLGIAMGKHTISIQATRGCPYNCIYCHKIWPKTHVTRSAGHIFEEIRRLHDAGVKRFAFIDDIFNLEKENATKLLEQIIKHFPGLQLFFPNGLRGDILDKEFIDLMVEAGTVNIDVALETASPRLQKLIRKHLRLDRFKENVKYIAEKYPHVILEMELMMGFPTETEEEVEMILDFLKEIKWLHFPNLNILKVFPNTDMFRLAVANGVSSQAIENSTAYAYHELPDTLPYSKQFAREFQTRFMTEYMLSKERLLHVLPYQAKILTEQELVLKYDSYFPEKIESFDDILQMAGIKAHQLPGLTLLKEDYAAAPNFMEKLKESNAQIPQTNNGSASHKLHPSTKAVQDGSPRRAPEGRPGGEPMRILLLDLSQFFSQESGNILYDVVEEPLGLLCLMSYLKDKFKERVDGRVYKSRIDFNSFGRLKELIMDFRPDFIGMRTLSYFKEFFHRTAAMIREWGIDVPIAAGGPYATSDYRQMLQDSHIDLAAFGEGELTMAELVEAMLENGKKLPSDEHLQKIDGITFINQEDKALLTKKRRRCISLDASFVPVDRGSQLPGKKEPDFSGREAKETPGVEGAAEMSEIPASPGDLLYLISTSGSTGKPKSVMLEHRNLGNLLEFQRNSTNLEFDRVLQYASIGFDVSAQEIFSTLLSGGTLFLIDKGLKHDVPALFDFIRQKEITTLFLPPAFLKFVFGEPRYAGLFPTCVKHIVAAGEQLEVTENLRRFLIKNRIYLHNHYGPTETHVVSHLTLSPDVEFEDIDGMERIPQFPSIGKPVTGTRLYILDEGRKLLPIGVPGELYISGANVGRGYYGKEQMTQERFLPDPFFNGSRMYRTGDRAVWLPDGNIQFLGRVDFQIKIRGFRIEPGEIEKRLTAYEAIKEAVVTVIEKSETGNTHPASKGDKYLCAYFTPNEEVFPEGESIVEAVKQYLALSLPDYMIPSYYVKMDRWPLTASGKINRKRLPEPKTGEGDGVEYVAPRNETEEKLTAIWADVLGGDQGSIGIDANFFSLGGHSLNATVMLTKIKEVFGIRMPLGEMFSLPTIRQLACYLAETEPGDQGLPAKAVIGAEGERVVLLKKGAEKGDGDRHLFLVHDGVGEIEGYLQFCNLLGGDMSCWGIRPDVDRFKIHGPRNLDISRLAREYIGNIKEIQPEGPYSIVGWSMGGSIAFEMLRQLEMENEAVGFFAMIDTTPPPTKENEPEELRFSLSGESEWVGQFFDKEKIADMAAKAGSLETFWEGVADYSEAVKIDVENVKALIPGNMSAAVPNLEHLTLRQLIYYLNVIRTYTMLCENYVPTGKVKAPVFYFAAKDGGKGEEWRKEWQGYVDKPLFSHEIAGTHFSMMRSPGVADLSQRITDSLQLESN